MSQKTTCKPASIQHPRSILAPCGKTMKAGGRHQMRPTNEATVGCGVLRLQIEQKNKFSQELSSYTTAHSKTSDFLQGRIL